MDIKWFVIGLVVGFWLVPMILKMVSGQKAQA